MGSFCYCNEDGQASSQLVRLVVPQVCPLTTSIRIALQFKGIQPESLEESCDCHCNAFALSPFRLEHGADVVESPHKIIHYIDKNFKWPPLFPSWWSSKVSSWVNHIREYLLPLVHESLKKSNLLDDERRSLISEALCKVDAGISSEGPFFQGKRFTMVDVYLIPVLEFLRCLSLLHGIQLKKTHLKVDNYIRRMVGFPAYVPVALDSTRLMVTTMKLLEDQMVQAPLVGYAVMQHRSIFRHLEKLASTVEKSKFEACKFKSFTTKEQMSHTTTLRQIGRDYDRLLVLIQNHARMEEQIIFPALEKAKRGVTKAVTEEHARDFPLMNGVREDIKSIVTLEPGTASYTEALNALLTKIKLMENHTKGHFREEEKEVLPLLEAAGLGTREQEALVVNCVNVMESAHMQLLPFYLSGLLTHEIHGYVVLLFKTVKDQALVNKMLHVLKTDEEFQWVWEVVQKMDI